MTSNFTRHVNSVIGSKSAELERRFYKHQNKIMEIEKRIDSGKIKTRADAMKELRGIFGSYISGSEYNSIEQKAKYDIK